MKNKDHITILGIESSCDETAAAVLQCNRDRFEILSNIVSSQINIHRPYGGVIPELAARNHLENILPVINQALSEAKIAPNKIDEIAVTTGPGLISSLLVGAQTAKTLAYSWNKPIVSINHLKAHIYANWLESQPIAFPAICLVVSGGHTELVLMKNKNSFKKIGQTLDDAAGEAFDKVAQLLNIGYPGGPIISKLAESGNPAAFDFPRPMIKSNNFNFSFSGLKTAVLYTRKKLPKINKKIIADICASFQQAATEVLVVKTIRAGQKYRVKTIMLAGGVAANKELRNQLIKKTTEKLPKVKIKIPAIKYCTDNAVMIAAAGYFCKKTPWEKIKVDPSLSL